MIEQDEDLAQVVTGHGPCTYLLLSLVALILIYPYLTEDRLSKVILGLLYASVLLGHAHAVGRDRRKLVAGLGLAVIAIGLQWAFLATHDVWLQRLMGMTYALFTVYNRRSAGLHTKEGTDHGGQAAWGACRLYHAGLSVALLRLD